MGSVKVAVAQAASILFDKDASVEKACQLVAEAGDNKSNIVHCFIFPHQVSYWGSTEN